MQIGWNFHCLPRDEYFASFIIYFSVENSKQKKERYNLKKDEVESNNIWPKYYIILIKKV